LEEVFEENEILSITFNRWTTKNYCQLETVTKSPDAFVEDFCVDLKALRQHDYIAKQQAAHLKATKKNLQEGEVVVICDFSENYAFIVQNSIQAYYWSNNQASLHPFVCYYILNGEEHHFCFVVISDIMHHDTVAVYLYQTMFINHLKTKLPNINKIFYFTDGAPSQYKNRKNFANICNHYADFNIEVVWNYFASSHGKGPCDGIGGTVKRLAAKASLQHVGVPLIDSAVKFFSWAQSNIKGASFGFTTKLEYEKINKKLEPRFCNLKSVNGNFYLSYKF
jgi:hypothetical protein